MKKLIQLLRLLPKLKTFVAGLLEIISNLKALIRSVWPRTKAITNKGESKMQISDEGLIALMLHEGIVPAPYKDSVGVWTYGVGHTKAAGEPDPKTMPKGMPADLDAELQFVFDVFREDLKKYGADVAKAINVVVSQSEFDAAVSFHYNTGAISTATWVKTLNGGDRALAGQQIMNWSKPPEIIPRRTAEQVLFTTGIYPSGNITVWKVDDNGKVIWSPERTLSGKEVLAMMNDPVEPTPEPTPTPTPTPDDDAIQMLCERVRVLEERLERVAKAWSSL